MMKKILIVLVAFVSLVGCKGNDKKTTGTNLSQEEKDKAVRDSSNFTVIQWLDSTYTDLGKVKEGQVVEVSYRFKNAGTKNLIIATVSASCGCTVPEKPEKPFAPGEEGVIKAKFDSKGKPHGIARKEIYVTANTNPSQTNLVFGVEITDK
jgi:Protein of unknown function (DUF1573)